MELTALMIFTGALLVAAASPGPGIAALVARVLGNGLAGVVPFTAGLISGDLVWLAAAVLGLAVIAHAFHEVLLVIKYAGAAYLLYLAWRMWTAPAEALAVSPRRERRASLFFAGLSVSLGNPKVIGFYVALLPNLIDLDHAGVVGYLELAGVCVATLVVVLGVYAIAAARARSLFRSPRAIKLFNRTSGTLMAGAAVAVAAR
jgi:threonine/homoserine/homoserine lactone efflux protein